MEVLVLIAVRYGSITRAANTALLAVCAILAGGCVTTGGPSAERAFAFIGRPVARAVESWRERGVPVTREYTTPKGVRVVVIPEGPECQIHYFVDSSGIISGFMLIGDRCTTYRTHNYSEIVVIPSGVAAK